MNQKEYIYQAEILDAETNEVIAKVSSFSQEGLEEEMGKTKYAEATKRYEEGLEKERLQDEEDAMDAELEADNLADKKLEEDLVQEEEEGGETFAEHLESIKRE